MSWLLYDKPGYGRRLEWIQLANAEALLAAGVVEKRWGWYVQAQEGVPPFIIIPATLAGTAKVGFTLTCVSQFAGKQPIDLEFVWTKTPGGVIAGATEGSYDVVEADIGATITCTVTATNEFGDESSTSAPSAAVVAADAPMSDPESPEFYKPANTALPSITGTVQVGEMVTCLPGSWDANPAADYAYQWKRDSQPIPMASGPTYVLAPEDETLMVTCTVVASNSEGSSQRTTAAVGPVLP